MKKQKQSVGKGGNYLAARKQHFVNTFEKWGFFCKKPEEHHATKVQKK